MVLTCQAAKQQARRINSHQSTQRIHKSVNTTQKQHWLHPSCYRTQICRDGAACRRKVCFFAHSAEQLRVPLAGDAGGAGGGYGGGG